MNSFKVSRLKSNILFKIIIKIMKKKYICYWSVEWNHAYEIFFSCFLLFFKFYLYTWTNKKKIRCSVYDILKLLHLSEYALFDNSGRSFLASIKLPCSASNIPHSMPIHWRHVKNTRDMRYENKKKYYLINQS